MWKTNINLAPTAARPVCEHDKLSLLHPAGVNKSRGALAELNSRAKRKKKKRKKKSGRGAFKDLRRIAYQVRSIKGSRERRRALSKRMEELLRLNKNAADRLNKPSSASTNRRDTKTRFECISDSSRNEAKRRRQSSQSRGRSDGRVWKERGGRREKSTKLEQTLL